MKERRKLPELRSNLEPGTTAWAVRRAQWKALGLSDEDLLKPKIAVVNTSSELSICFSHLDDISVIVKQAIREAGGVAFEVRTVAPSDFVTCAARAGRYILPSRDLLVNDIEVSVEGPLLDGMVCLSSCDKTTPAHLMAAARLNIPTVIVPCGYQGCGEFEGEPIDVEDVFESAGMVSTGAIDIETMGGMCDAAITTPGVCAGMGTANSMHVMAEALGMAPPGSTPIAAIGPRMDALAADAEARIVRMIEQDIRPLSILTPEAFANAMAVALALSTSINVLRHLQAVAEEGAVDVNVYDLIDRLGPRVPVLCAVKPNGPKSIIDLENAGGTAAVLKQLESVLNTRAKTISGEPMADLLAVIPEAPVMPLASLEAPVSPGPSLMILRGSLAPDGSIVKVGAAPARSDAFRGPANVYESQEEALDALSNGGIEAGQVVILRGLGSRGGPGVASASWFVAAMQGAGLGDKIAVVTDGQLSGLNRGFVVGQVMPEAARGGPLALVQTGDPIVIDLASRRIDLAIDGATFEARRAALPDFEMTETKGWLGIYQRLVQPLARGGVLRP
ncbi:MAG: dihydroxy-acid dehydratase [Alphaproteobacteria bacterium]|nr:dihydroxy-acid dehydratase [Alphaproteobacteria bacterium]